LTSDLHFGHKLVAGTRGFEDPVDHDVRVQRNWLRLVAPTDTVWVLGDISSGGAAAQMASLAILKQLPGVKYLVAGNHDSVHPKHRGKAIQWDHVYRDVFTYICSQACVAVAGHRLMLSHFPYHHDRGEVRYPEWRLRDEGRWLAHGHTHEEAVWDAARPREFNVALDAHGLKPVNLGAVGAFIKNATDPDDRMVKLLNE
jgi:calcineurin-like phosphoesterase family protein